MDYSNARIPEEIASEVLEVASRMYAEANNSYSVQDLQQAGQEVSIPPELIEKAIQEVQAKHRREQLEQQQARHQQQILTRISIGITAILLLWGILIYNSLTQAKQNVYGAWAQVENQMQRRADLIPELVAVTQAQAKQEQDLIQLLNQSRNTYLQSNSLAEKIAATEQINFAIQQFNQSVAPNPQFQSSQAFTNLQYELAGTENRIATERQRYNQAVQSYNQKLQTFPNSMISSLFGFKEQPYFRIRN